jgi:hypothetical protein
MPFDIGEIGDIGDLPVRDFSDDGPVGAEWLGKAIDQN